MKGTTEIESHEQKEKGETAQEADFTMNSTDFKVTCDGMFGKVGDHAFVLISWHARDRRRCDTAA